MDEPENTEPMSEALVEALGVVVSDLRREWRKELDAMRAEIRTMTGADASSPLPDAMRKALGKVIATMADEWRKEMQIIAAEARAVVAETKLAATGDRSASDLQKRIDARLAKEAK